jgi:SAM-dependent methyltransferase
MIEAETLDLPRLLHRPACRHCGAPLTTLFADLGETPVTNDFLTEDALRRPEPVYPLRAFVCSDCRLAQLEDFLRSDDLFRADYPYFSSVSTSFLEHARRYVEEVSARFGLGPGSTVVEAASNDGYLLQYFMAKGLRALGVEPCRSVAECAIRDRGAPTHIAFFSQALAHRLVEEGHAADLVVANNVLGHVPDINDFVKGLATLLAPGGVATLEFPSLLNLIRLNQFDTIYHEHFSYLSLTAAHRLLAANGLRVFDVEPLATHGGSLRLFACRETDIRPRTPRLRDMLDAERDAGLDDDPLYLGFAARVEETKRALRDLLHGLRRDGRTVVAYGAPAKGNTLLNACGITRDLVDFTVDRSPHKQGLYLPGSHLPILAPEAIDRAKPDYVLILPWNLREEIVEQMAHVRDWGGRFILPIPHAEIV